MWGACRARMIASRARVGPANARETLHVGHARRRWKKESVQDGRGNSVDDTGNVAEATGNSTGEPRQHAGRRGQRDECHLPQPRRVKKRTNCDLVTASRGPVTRRRTSATGHVASPTPAPRQGTYQLRSGNGQQVPGNATEDVGNVPSAISHTRTSVEQRPDTTG